jgi:hypothetical protein
MRRQLVRSEISSRATFGLAIQANSFMKGTPIVCSRAVDNRLQGTCNQLFVALSRILSNTAGVGLSFTPGGAYERRMLPMRLYMQSMTRMKWIFRLREVAPREMTEARVTNAKLEPTLR